MHSMRYRDAQVLLTEHIHQVRPKFRSVGGGNQVDFENKEQVRLAALALSNLPGEIGEKARALGSYEVFSASSTVIVADRHQGTVQSIADALASSGSSVLAFLDATLPKAPKLYIAVSIPTPSPAPDENATFQRRLHVALDHPQRLLGHAPLRITLADVGSIWSELAISSTDAYVIVAGLLAYGIARAKMQQQEAKAQQERFIAAQQLAKVDQELAKVDQEKAKVKQEELKVQQAEANVEFQRAEGQLELKKKHLEIAQLEASAEYARWSRGAKDPKEAQAALEAATTEVVKLFSEGAKFRGQLDAPAAIRAMLPEEARPKEAELVTPKAPPQLPETASPSEGEPEFEEGPRKA
jgi:hypothetical protein